MRISKSCNRHNNVMGRCHTPLISICDSTSQIKLDLGACGLCSPTPTSLVLQKGGCTEWETVCEPPRKDPCCGVVDNRPIYWGSKRAVEKPKPTIIYPLHEIDPQGMSVFVLDGKLKQLGYGRWHATVFVDNQPTDIVFDIDYQAYIPSLQGIETATLSPMGVC